MSASARGTPRCHRLAQWLAVATLATLAACTTTAPRKPPGPPPVPPTVAPPIGSVTRENSRWIPVAWQELPGWSADTPQAAWPALLKSCQRSPSAWSAFCENALQSPPRDDEELRAWLMRNLQPYRVESLEGGTSGLITGYYEPVFDARRVPGGPYRVALHAPPADLATRRPYWTREQLQTLPQAQSSLRGREIAYVASPLDALVLQIQGSGRLRITEPDGRTRDVRLAYAGTNDQPYRSVGRWLIDQGELQAGQATWPAISDWAQRNPARINELLWANPRYVFFREEPLPDPAIGPRGAQGVPLTPGRSIAVDPKSVPYGTPVWIDTTAPLSNSPLRRLVLAQDTGSAIVGAVRADYFWGWEGDAAEQAGRMRQPLRMWVLWPRAEAN
jgi:membrane-bound lytic murein transglycosylase A